MTRLGDTLLLLYGRSFNISNLYPLKSKTVIIRKA